MSASMAEVLAEVLGEVRDDGNCTGLDGWVGPGRGSAEIDDDALHARDRVIQKAEAALAAAGYGKLPDRCASVDKDKRHCILWHPHRGSHQFDDSYHEDRRPE